ncbi:MAG: flagellar motor switch protein FliG [Bryobacteraceae bacterium]|nr:flagellar motor switch protein FliG [Bryobacteraceae bacterium]
MILNTTKTAVTISPLRKAAVLLLTLGEETSALLMRQLSEDEVQAVSREVARTSAVTPEQAEAVLEEFQQMVLAREYVLKGGLEHARRLLVSAFGPEAAEKILFHLQRTLRSDSEDFTALQKADPQQLARFVQNEHPQTIALIVSQLSPSQAAALLMALPAEIRSDVTMRIANLDQISPEIIGRIASIIHQRLKGLGQLSRQSYGGVRAVAELLNRLDSSVSKEILESIGAQEAGLAEQIRHLMFVFEDLLLIDPNGIKEILSKVDRKLLTVAMKGTSEQLKNHILGCMSQRGREMLLEDMEAMGPVKIREVEAAQQAIIAVVRQLESEGVLSLKEAAGEQYVV